MKRVLYFLFIGLFVFSCKKDETGNPFDNIEVIENQTPDFGAVSETNFAFLHEKVFAPTCANSGCHDGSFEPEFRSISSSFNSLVNHAVISNDPQNSFTKRVVPGSIDMSLLNARLTEFLPNTSGIMPLEVDEDSDWDENSADYINRIQEWITAGAPDMYGNLPGLGSVNLPPSIDGFLVFPEGDTTTPYERDPDVVGITPILVNSQVVDIWILISDDQTPPNEFTLTQVTTALAIADLNELDAVSYIEQSPLTALDFSGNNSNYIFKASIDLSGLQSGTVIYLRNFLNDGDSSENTEVPNSNSNDIITSLFTLEII